MRTLFTVALAAMLTLFSIPQAMAGTKIFQNKTGKGIQVILLIRIVQNYSIPTSDPMFNSTMLSYWVSAGERATINYHGDNLNAIIVSGDINCSYYVPKVNDRFDKLLNGNREFVIAPLERQPFQCELKPVS